MVDGPESHSVISLPWPPWCPAGTAAADAVPGRRGWGGEAGGSAEALR